MDDKRQFPASHHLAPANDIPLSASLPVPNYGYHGNPTPSLLAAPESGYYGSPDTLSSQPDAYFMQRGGAGQRHQFLIASYPCLFPRCEAQFQHEALLEQHMTLHFGPSLEISGAGGALSRHPNQNVGNCHEAVDVTSASAPSAGPSVSQVGNDLNCPITRQDASDNGSIRTSPANAKKIHYCRGRFCSESFTRFADLERHEETHYATGKVKTFECPELGCNRTGERGFTRRDKIVDHVRAKHKRSVGRGEFRNHYRQYWDERKNWLASNGFGIWGTPLENVPE